MINLYFQFK